jgi:ubiquinone/menaquinone biosynthesis C-methylase UbiE
MMAQADDVHSAFIAPHKRRLLGDLHGDLLEIGPGAGPNFGYYAADVRWTGVEPNPYMHAYLRANAATQGRKIDLRTGYTEALPVDDESMDVVVSTLVLCSVRDLNASLAEVRRVLRPGGKFVFIEHVAATTGSGLRRVQNWVQPVWSFAADGCHPNREIWRHLEEAGFAQLALEHFDIAVPIVKPHIAGVAVK